MSGGWLFLLGWGGLGLLVALAVLAARAWSNFDPIGPGSPGAARLGCTCSRWSNWGGLREAVTGRATLARHCPVMAHWPEVRRRMYNWSS